MIVSRPFCMSWPAFALFRGHDARITSLKQTKISLKTA